VLAQVTANKGGDLFLRYSIESNNDAGVSLDSAAKKQLVLVATCHVHWDPEFCDVKLIQTMMFMNRLQNIIKEAQASLLPSSSSSSDCNQIPVILCGDLNSLPESGVVCLCVIYIYIKLPRLSVLVCVCVPDFRTTCGPISMKLHGL